LFPGKFTGDTIVQGSTQDFKSAADALAALDRMTECKCDTDVKAYRYFVSHPDESIPLLIDFTLKHKQRYQVGIKALSRFRDERVITFLLELVDDELHNRPSAKTGDNSYNETHPYSSESLLCSLIEVFGDYGEKRAIPIIQGSMSRLNNQDAETDVEALCKLGVMSIPELYEWHSKSAEAMTTIALSNVHTNPRFSVELFDWVINGFPKQPKLLKSCHVGKVMALYNEQEYALALRECEILKQNIEGDSPDQISFVIDHFSYSLDEMMRFLKNGRDRSRLYP
jgi:hypothetical protein